MKKNIIVLGIISLLCCARTFAQGGIDNNTAHKHNFIAEIDLGSHHIYSMAAASILSGHLNSWIGKPLFTTSFLYTPVSAKIMGNDIDVKTCKFNGLRASDIFGDIKLGLNIGLQTYRPEIFNYGFTVSAYYRQNQFRLESNTERLSAKHNIQRCMAGANLFAVIGEMGQMARIVVEAGAGYSFPLAYNDPMNIGNDAVQDGIYSHYAIKITGPTFLQDCCIFADINHFDLINGIDNKHNIEITDAPIVQSWTIGFSCKVTLFHSENRK